MPVEEERKKKEEKDEQSQNFQIWFFKVVKG